MQHQEQQQQLALATSMSVLADINVLCVASKADQSTRGLASAPPYAAAQDEIQKRIIADLREEDTSLRARVNTLKAMVLENQAKSLN